MATDLTSNRIRQGWSAYDKEGKSIVGSIPTKTKSDVTVTEHIATIPYGYYDSAITVAASELVSDKLEITDTTEKDVTNYQKAQIVDSNLVESNIKKDTVILGLTGTLDYTSTVTSVPSTKTTSIIYNSTDTKYYLWKE